MTQEDIRAEKARRVREWRHKNPERAKQIKKNWIAKNRDQYLQSMRNQQLKIRYGITLDDFNKMFVEQSGKCKICGREGGEDNRTRLVVDHDHTTSIIRGLICQPCNAMVGMSAESPDTLRNAAKYLETYGLK
jgi:hypothetical protein